MVKMINGLFGNVMWVADDRVEEYEAAGHRLAALPAAEKSTKPKKKPVKKGASKK